MAYLEESLFRVFPIEFPIAWIAGPIMVICRSIGSVNQFKNEIAAERIRLHDFSGFCQNNSYYGSEQATNMLSPKRFGDPFS